MMHTVTLFPLCHSIVLSILKFRSQRNHRRLTVALRNYRLSSALVAALKLPTGAEHSAIAAFRAVEGGSVTLIFRPRRSDCR